MHRSAAAAGGAGECDSVHDPRLHPFCRGEIDFSYAHLNTSAGRSGSARAVCRGPETDESQDGGGGGPTAQPVDCFICLPGLWRLCQAAELRASAAGLASLSRLGGGSRAAGRDGGAAAARRPRVCKGMPIEARLGLAMQRWAVQPVMLQWAPVSSESTRSSRVQIACSKNAVSAASARPYPPVFGPRA